MTVVTGQEKNSIIETQPLYPGGMKNFHNYLTSNLNLSKSQLKELKGDKLFIQFVINEDGTVNQESVSTVSEMTTITNNEVINTAERLIKSSEVWTPGTRNGESINMRLVVPINF